MEKSKKLSMIIIITIVVLAISIDFFYSSGPIQPNQSTQPNQSEQSSSSTHHFQVNVNDTFVIGEKHS